MAQGMEANNPGCKFNLVNASNEWNAEKDKFLRAYKICSKIDNVDELFAVHLLALHKKFNGLCGCDVARARANHAENASKVGRSVPVDVGPALPPLEPGCRPMPPLAPIKRRMNALDSGATFEGEIPGRSSEAVSLDNDSTMTHMEDSLGLTCSRIPNTQEKSALSCPETSSTMMEDKQRDDGGEEQDWSSDDDDDDDDDRDGDGSDEEVTRGTQRDSSDSDLDKAEQFTVINKNPGLYVFHMNKDKQDGNSKESNKTKKAKWIGEKDNHLDIEKEDEEDENWIECDGMDYGDIASDADYNADQSHDETRAMQEEKSQTKPESAMTSLARPKVLKDVVNKREKQIITYSALAEKKRTKQPPKRKMAMFNGDFNLRRIHNILEYKKEFQCNICVARYLTVKEFKLHMEESHSELADKFNETLTSRLDKSRSQFMIGNQYETADERKDKIQRFIQERKKWETKLENAQEVDELDGSEQSGEALMETVTDDEGDGGLWKDDRKVCDTLFTSDAMKACDTLSTTCSDADEEARAGDFTGHGSVCSTWPGASELVECSLHTESMKDGPQGAESSRKESEDIQGYVNAENSSNKSEQQPVTSKKCISGSNFVIVPGLSIEEMKTIIADLTLKIETLEMKKCPWDSEAFCPEMDEYVLVEMGGWSTLFLQCNACSQSVLFSKMSTHINTVHRNSGLGFFFCDKCNQRLITEEGYIDHMTNCMKEVKRGSRYIYSMCEACGKIVPRPNLEEHMNKVHNKGPERVQTCKICNAEVKFRRLHVHQKIHMQVKSEICHVCGRGFAQKYALKSHMRQHTNEKPYKCEECGKAFAHKVSMKSHAKRYHGIDLWANQTGPMPGRWKKRRADDKQDLDILSITAVDDNTPTSNS